MKLTRLSARTIASGMLLPIIMGSACALAQSGGPPAATGASAGQACGPIGPMVIPSGIDISRLTMLDEGRQYKVYAALVAADARDPSKSVLPARMAKLVEMSPAGLQSIFMQQLLRSRRFEIYDMRPNVTAEFSDVLITAMVVDADQVLRNYLEGGRRVSESRVRMAVEIKHMYTGKLLNPSDALVEGRTGITTGQRVVVSAAESTDSPETAQRLAVDFKHALERAFSQATERLEELLRPLAQVISIADCQVDLFGGSRNGLQAGDEMIVFRTQKLQRGESLMMTNTRAVARIRCDTVGTENSTCEIFGTVAGYRPQDGDYAAITDAALARTRQR